MDSVVRISHERQIVGVQGTELSWSLRCGASGLAGCADQDYLEYRRLWVQRPMDCNPGAFPLHLDIETTNYCNLRCIMCPRTKFMAQSDWRWSPKGLGRMDWDTYTSLIDQAAAGGAWSVKLNLLANPCCTPW